MTELSTAPRFRPLGPDAAGVLSWAHIGDLHMALEGQQNHHDLRAIVAEIQGCFAGSISFVFLPGDIADDGSRAAYAVVRRALDTLQVPWCAIVGDHDVHEKSFTNFLEMMSLATQYAFTVGSTRFIAMNAFQIPDPGSFAVLPDQLAWCEQELVEATTNHMQKVILLHCYPSELKTGAEQLTNLIRRYGVRLVDMGHTHYNEVANDGHTIYTATRSTGQIEEGPVGFSIASFDHGVVSWKFVELGALPAVMITSPSDARLQMDSETTLGHDAKGTLVRAKVWARSRVVEVSATFGKSNVPLLNVDGTQVWEGFVPWETAANANAELRVWAEDAEGASGDDSIQVATGDAGRTITRMPRDRDNALAAWLGHGLLGTQLGPNKNGRKW